MKKNFCIFLTLFIVSYSIALAEEVSQNYGTLNQDVTISTNFFDTVKGLDKYRCAADDALISYQKAAKALSSSLLTKYITQDKLIDADKKRLQEHGEEMLQATLNSLICKHAENNLYIEALFDGDYSNESLLILINASSSYFDDLKDEAYSAWEALQNQLVAAMQDDVISEQEHNAIDTIVQRFNEVNAEKEENEEKEKHKPKEIPGRTLDSPSLFMLLYDHEMSKHGLDSTINKVDIDGYTALELSPYCAAILSVEKDDIFAIRHIGIYDDTKESMTNIFLSIYTTVVIVDPSIKPDDIMPFLFGILNNGEVNSTDRCTYSFIEFKELSTFYLTITPK